MLSERRAISPGPTRMRAAAFLEFANDPAFDAIWFARGGYGSNRILDPVMPRARRRRRATKSYIGYSDWASCSARSMPGASGGRSTARW